MTKGTPRGVPFVFPFSLRDGDGEIGIIGAIGGIRGS